MFSKLKLIFRTFSQKERLIFIALFIVFTISAISRVTLAINENSQFVPVGGGTYKEGEIGQLIAINPLISQNPVDLDLSALVYENLFNLLATSEKSKDGRLYTLKLKEGLKWSDNEPLTSDDVIFTIQTIQDPDTKSPLAKSWQGVVAERVSQLEVQLNLPTPYAFMTDNIKRLPILPKHIFGDIPTANLALSSYNLEPVSSGPYRFKEMAKRRDGFITDYVLTANDNYSGDRVFIKDFYFKFYENESGVADALRLHQINGFGTLNPSFVSDAGNLVIEKIPMPRYYAVFMNQNVNPLLKKADLRKALTEAVDTEKINQEALGGSGAVLAGPLFDASELSQTNVQASNYDPLDAQKLVSGVKKDKPLELTLIVPQVDFLLKTADIIKDEWLSAGVDKVNVEALGQNDLMDNVIKPRNYELLLFGNALENPMDLFSFWHSSERFYPGLNLSLYQNPKVDNLLETIRQTDDVASQKSYLQSAVNLIEGDYPAVFLFSLPYTYFHSTNLMGFDFQNDSQFLITPADRFQNVDKWSVSKARVIK